MVRSVLPCLFAAVATLAATVGIANAAPVRGGTLNFVVTPEPPSLVNLTTSAVPVLKVSAKVTEGLLAYDFKYQPTPQLATACKRLSRHVPASEIGRASCRERV